MKIVNDTWFGIAEQYLFSSCIVDNDDLSVYIAVEGRNYEEVQLRYNKIICSNEDDTCPKTFWSPLNIKSFSEVSESFVESEETNCVVHFLSGKKKKYLCAFNK